MTFWHQKMSAIPHHIEERWGQILHKRASFVPNETERIVQFRSTPSKGSLYVRPGTVWSYVLIPSHRTCWHPLNVRLQSQRRTSKGFLAGEFDVLYLMGAIFSLSEKRVFALRSTTMDFVAFSGRQWMSKWKQNAQIRYKKCTKGVLIWQGSLTRVL